MKKPDITNGEWAVKPSGNTHFDICICTKKDGGSVCHVTNWSEKEANAKAISAVPEMIDALLAVIEHNNIPCQENYDNMINATKHALKKAGCTND